MNARRPSWDVLMGMIDGRPVYRTDVEAHPLGWHFVGGRDLTENEIRELNLDPTPTVNMDRDFVCCERGEHGPNHAFVRAVTGYSDELLHDLGGVPEDVGIPNTGLVEVELDWSPVEFVHPSWKSNLTGRNGRA